jgi:serine/threonine protein kinase
VSEQGRLVAGRYRLAERIGRGGMGTVWCADDEVLDRRVALKQLHEQPHLSPDELGTLYERMRREARSAARVTHPGVVVVHDVVEDGALVWSWSTFPAPPSAICSGTAAPSRPGRRPA